MKETYLANLIINYFEKMGYETYKEVLSSKNTRRADCFFIKRNLDGEIVDGIVVETKTTFSLKVMEQCKLWYPYANRIYIGIPKAKRKDFKMRKFGYDICKNYLKIGIIEVDTINEIVSEKVISEYNPKPKYPVLYEQQKDSIAGNDKSDYFTPFKNTLILIQEHMVDKETEDYKTMIKSIKHHYVSNQSAFQSLKQYFGSLIPNYILIQENKKWIIKLR